MKKNDMQRRGEIIVNVQKKNKREKNTQIVIFKYATCNCLNKNRDRLTVS